MFIKKSKKKYNYLSDYDKLKIAFEGKKFEQFKNLIDNKSFATNLILGFFKYSCENKQIDYINLFLQKKFINRDTIEILFKYKYYEKINELIYRKIIDGKMLKKVLKLACQYNAEKNLDSVLSTENIDPEYIKKVFICTYEKIEFKIVELMISYLPFDKSHFVLICTSNKTNVLELYTSKHKSKINIGYLSSGIVKTIENNAYGTLKFLLENKNFQDLLYVISDLYISEVDMIKIIESKCVKLDHIVEIFYYANNNPNYIDRNIDTVINKIISESFNINDLLISYYNISVKKNGQLVYDKISQKIIERILILPKEIIYIDDDIINYIIDNNIYLNKEHKYNINKHLFRAGMFCNIDHKYLLANELLTDLYRIAECDSSEYMKFMLSLNSYDGMIVISDNIFTVDNFCRLLSIRQNQLTETEKENFPPIIYDNHESYFKNNRTDSLTLTYSYAKIFVDYYLMDGNNPTNYDLLYEIMKNDIFNWNPNNFKLYSNDIKKMIFLFIASISIFSKSRKFRIPKPLIRIIINFSLNHNFYKLNKK